MRSEFELCEGGNKNQEGKRKSHGVPEKSEKPMPWSSDIVGSQITLPLDYRTYQYYRGVFIFCVTVLLVLWREMPHYGRVSDIELGSLLISSNEIIGVIS